MFMLERKTFDTNSEVILYVLFLGYMNTGGSTQQFP
jgi:hypothetical protein